MTRKTFLRSLGVGTVGLLAARAPGANPETSWTLPPYNPKNAEDYWRAVRAGFPLEDDPLYLNTGGLGPASNRVLTTVETIARQLQRHSETGHELLDPARLIVANFLGAQSDEICFTRNATEANSIIAAGLELNSGDEVIFESHAHPGGSFPWFNQVRQRGIKVRLFDPDPTSPEANLQRIRELIGPRTKVIQVSHITCTTGLLLPVR
ncbi:MAG: aminotransferase class V-fold PLP-dependent enzyme, partial [Opitutus sp.]